MPPLWHRAKLQAEVVASMRNGRWSATKRCATKTPRLKNGFEPHLETQFFDLVVVQHGVDLQNLKPEPYQQKETLSP
jgi:hypothetical protein